ncbi:pyridoxamine 5'-phosphate oxidase family protein [Embleya sp. AB8]|uniref:pyridoxamine 5'-phosphate oxidase family protein n=1 Tax=Embleya sp. AB8 TaxID=3156304 RepID=UPI003C714071
MTGWSEFEKAEPEFAATVRERFGMYKHHVLGTLRRDGSPRLTGLEADFRFGQLWLGMMPGSLKARDLLRDPRFSLFANPGEGAQMAHGDVRVSGRAIEEVDEELKARYVGATGAPTPFHLFRVELAEVSRIGVEGEEIVVRTWRPGGAVRTIRRGNAAETAREEG